MHELLNSLFVVPFVPICLGSLDPVIFKGIAFAQPVVGRIFLMFRLE